jgi:class 3 adenylate cyclase
MALADEAPLFRIVEPPLRRKIAAILAADVAGYSRLVAEAEEDTLRELAASREIFDGLVARAGGRIFNTAGDSVMCEFDSAVEAVRVAIDIQESLASRNAGVDARRRLQFRMGLTIGDVVERDGDLLGDGVNIAARLESLSPPGGICVSRSVHEAVSNKIAVEFRDIGQRQVKNIPQAIHAFVVEPPRAAYLAEGDLSVEPFAPRRREPVQTGRRRPALWIAGAVALAVVVGLPGLKAARHALESVSAGKPPSNLAATQTEGPAPDTANKATSSETTANKNPAPAAPKSTAQAPAPLTVTPTPAPVTRPAPAPAPKPARPALPGDPAAAYATLSKEGIVSEPSHVAEFYHNGRLQEGRDKAAALRSYTALVQKSAEFLDADLRYAAMQRAVNGPAAARTASAELARSSKAGAAEIVAAIQAEPAERRARLEAIAADDPDNAPAAYFLAEDYLAERQGGPTLTERRLAFDALNTFLETSASPKAAAAFIDRSVLTSWREAAQKRQGEIEVAFATVKTRPTASFARSETGWTTNLSLPEPALGVAYRVGEQGEFQSTGTSPSTDPRTGKPTPRTRFELPASQGRATLYITYTDLSDHVAGPFPIAFDPGASLVATERETLERFPESWVTFRPDIPDLLSVTQLLSNRCAISQALIGFGDGPPREPLPLPPCNEQNPYAIPPNARSVLNIPAGADAVQVQLTYADGTESQVRTFRRP